MPKTLQMDTQNYGVVSPQVRIQNNEMQHFPRVRVQLERETVNGYDLSTRQYPEVFQSNEKMFLNQIKYEHHRPSATCLRNTRQFFDFERSPNKTRGEFQRMNVKHNRKPVAVYDEIFMQQSIYTKERNIHNNILSTPYNQTEYYRNGSSPNSESQKIAINGLNKFVPRTVPNLPPVLHSIRSLNDLSHEQAQLAQQQYSYTAIQEGSQNRLRNDNKLDLFDKVRSLEKTIFAKEQKLRNMEKKISQLVAESERQRIEHEAKTKLTKENQQVNENDNSCNTGKRNIKDSFAKVEVVVPENTAVNGDCNQKNFSNSKIKKESTEHNNNNLPSLKKENTNKSLTKDLAEKDDEFSESETGDNLIIDLEGIEESPGPAQSTENPHVVSAIQKSGRKTPLQSSITQKYPDSIERKETQQNTSDSAEAKLETEPLQHTSFRKETECIINKNITCDRDIEIISVESLKGALAERKEPEMKSGEGDVSRCETLKKTQTSNLHTREKDAFFNPTHQKVFPKKTNKEKVVDLRETVNLITFSSSVHDSKKQRNEQASNNVSSLSVPTTSLTAERESHLVEKVKSIDDGKFEIAESHLILNRKDMFSACIKQDGVSNDMHFYGIQGTHQKDEILSKNEKEVEASDEKKLSRNSSNIYNTLQTPKNVSTCLQLCQTAIQHNAFIKKPSSSISTKMSSKVPQSKFNPTTRTVPSSGTFPTEYSKFPVHMSQSMPSKNICNEQYYSGCNSLQNHQLKCNSPIPSQCLRLIPSNCSDTKYYELGNQKTGPCNSACDTRRNTPRGGMMNECSLNENQILKQVLQQQIVCNSNIQHNIHGSCRPKINNIQTLVQELDNCFEQRQHLSVPANQISEKFRFPPQHLGAYGQCGQEVSFFCCLFQINPFSPVSHFYTP